MLLLQLLKYIVAKSKFLQCLKKKVKQNPNEPKISPVKLRQKDNQLGVISKSSKIKGMEKKYIKETLNY